MSRRSVIVAVTTALLTGAVSGCGPTPPQAPLPEAQRLDTSLSGISTACGLSYQSTGLDHGASAHLAGLDNQAAAQARKLVSVYERNPDWIYQGERVAFIAQQTLTTLEQCGLHGGGMVLARALAKH